MLSYFDFSIHITSFHVTTNDCNQSATGFFKSANHNPKSAAFFLFSFTPQLINLCVDPRDDKLAFQGRNR